MLIAVDWGTTHLRAYLLDEGGRILERTRSGSGLMGVKDGAFEAALVEAVAPFRAQAGDAPVLMCGMVGSRQGWVEAPYVMTPASLPALAAGVVPVETAAFGTVHIIPGVAINPMTGWADVIRGEEVQAFGALDLLGRHEGLLVLPGTHSKWATVEGEVIRSFRTYMTGDIFGALSKHTILSRTMSAEYVHDEDAFQRGLTAARDLKAPGDLLSRLFSVRAEGLFGRLSDGASASFLSGILIGAEVGRGVGAVREVILAGSSSLSERYRTALESFGVSVVTAPEESAAHGIALVARARAATAATAPR